MPYQPLIAEILPVVDVYDAGFEPQDFRCALEDDRMFCSVLPVKMQGYADLVLPFRQTGTVKIHVHEGLAHLYEIVLRDLDLVLRTDAECDPFEILEVCRAAEKRSVPVV